MFSTLSIDNIMAACGPAARQISMTLVDETGSTNTDLLESVPRLSGPTLLVAERQTAGKGRAGRVWHSEPGATLTFSLAWKFPLAAQGLIGLPLVVGVVIAETLARFDVDARLKWPNDVLLDGGKMAGVLIETVADKSAAITGTATGIWAVIGIGINILMPDELARRIGRAAGAATGLRAHREPILAALLDGLVLALGIFEQQGFAAFRERWNRLHAYGRQPVMIIDHGQILHEGQASGVDESGRLLLDTSAGQIAVLAGDVSLRLQEPGA